MIFKFFHSLKRLLSSVNIFLILFFDLNKLNRYLNNKLTPFTFFTIYFYFTALCFDNIITQTQSQSCSLSCWFGSKEWLEDFISYVLRNTVAVVFYTYFN